MTDLRQTIVPKSDQLNADDLIDGPRTIKITNIKAAASSDDQPVAISFEGDRGKPYKPCKSMRRVLVKVWGADGAKYIGQRMTIYRDDKVTFGGMEVGGIRISHMSGIDAPVKMALTAAKAKRALYTVQPLGPEEQKPDAIAEGMAKAIPWLQKQESGAENATAARERVKALLERCKSAGRQADIDQIEAELKRIAG